MNRRRRILCAVVALAAIGLAIYVGTTVYDWVQTTIGKPLPWANLYDITFGMKREEIITVFGEPTQIRPTELRWEGSNGWIQIAFDKSGNAYGWAHGGDPQYGIKKVWKKTYLPYAWLSYFVELQHP